MHSIKKPYSTPQVSLETIRMERVILVGSEGTSVFDTARIQSTGQSIDTFDASTGSDDTFKFTWE